MNTLQKTLMRARDLIAGGWVRGYYSKKVNGKQCYCAVGAIRKATRSPQLRAEAVGKVADVLGFVSSWGSVYSTGKITLWNDAVPHNDKRYVLRAFDKAIKLAA